MSGHNRVQLVGNIGQDPELRHTNAGTAVLSLRMATTEVYFNKDREKKENTEWHTVVVWGKRAEAISKFIHKGDQIFIEGALRTRKWETKEGDTRYTTEVHVREIVLCGKRRGGTPQSDDSPEARRAAQGPWVDSDARDAFGSQGDDDIPF
ncbi:hypothetical protein LCGC14_0982050 [marine sediment metagenome]|uniref:Single-stranded DNA-binding protein n=1 Tax=marine sediment metagenome TaxID=412755 RepID=A0A0F9RF15_9ZZZZ